MLIEYDVSCFERTMVIQCPDSYSQHERHILHLLDEYYTQWHNPEEIEDDEDREWVESDACCEEYMYTKLRETYPECGKWDSFYYGDDENEAAEEYGNKRETYHSNVDLLIKTMEQLQVAQLNLDVFERIGNETYHAITSCIEELKTIKNMQYAVGSTYKCKACGYEIFIADDEFDCGGHYHPDGEELLWGHIQMEHDDIFEDVQDLETPFMIEECYEEEE